MQLGPLGATGDADASPEDTAFVAAVSTTRALTHAATAPQATINADSPTRGRRAVSDLPMLVITCHCRRRTPDEHQRSIQGPFLNDLDESLIS